MVSGYNVNVKAGGKVYHVQTEDKGRDNPVIETLIYLEGGKIIHQERTSYADKNDDDYHKETIRLMLDGQHNRMMKAVRDGVFDPDRRPFGEEFMTDRTLDQCILDYLKEESEKEVLALSYVKQEGVAAGAEGALTVRAVLQKSGSPVAGAMIHGKLIRSDGSPDPLKSVETDADGEARLVYKIPADASVNAAIVVQAESDHGRDEMSRMVC